MNIDEHSKQADKGHRKTIRKKTYKSKRFKEGENYDHNWSKHSSITGRQKYKQEYQNWDEAVNKLM